MNKCTVQVQIMHAYRSAHRSISFLTATIRCVRKASCTGMHSSWQVLQRHLRRLRLPRELCLGIMRLEPCTRQFSIRTGPAHRKLQHGPVGTYEPGKLARRVNVLSPVSVFIRETTRSSKFALHVARCIPAKQDDTFADPPSTPVPRLSRCPVRRKRRTTPSSDRFANTTP